MRQKAEIVRKANVVLASIIACSAACGRLVRIDLGFIDFSVVGHPENLFWFLLPGSVFVLLAGGNRTIPWGIPGYVLLGYVTYTLLSPLYGRFPHLAAGEALNVAKVLAFGALVVVNIRDKNDIAICLAGCLVGTTILAGIGCYQYFWVESDSVLYRVRGTLPDKNYFGGIVLIGCALSFAFFAMTSWRWQWRLGSLVIFLFHWVIIVMAGVRMMFLGLIAGTMLFILLQSRPVRIYSFIGIIALTILLLVLPIDDARTRILSSFSLSDPSFQFRWRAIWPFIFDLWMNGDPILGAGVGGFDIRTVDGGRELLENLGPFPDAHNAFLQTLWKQGVVGVLFAMFLVICLARLAYANFKKGHSSLCRIVGMATLIWLTAWCIHGFTWIFFYHIRHTLLVTLLVALNFAVNAFQGMWTSAKGCDELPECH